MGQENIAIQKIKVNLLQQYDESADLRRQFKTFADYAEYKVDRAFLEIEYTRNQSLQAEFQSVDRFVAFMMVEKKGLVKIIKNKTI